MASLFKQYGLFYGQFYSTHRTPQRKRVPLKTTKQKEARQRLAALEARYRDGDYDPWEDDPWRTEGDTSEGASLEEGGGGIVEGDEERVGLVTLREAIEAYLASCEHLREVTQTTYKQILEPFRDHMGGDLPVSSLTPAHVTRWLDATSAGDVTRRKYNNHLGYLFRFLVREGAMERDLSKAVKLRKVPEQAPKAMTQAMVETFVSKARSWPGYDWLADLVEANVEMGLRRAELVALKAENVDLERGVLRVMNGDGFTTKSGKERAVPLSSMARRVLKRRLERGTPYVFQTPSVVLTCNWLSNAFWKVREATDLPKWVNLHSTRHTALTRLAERGVPVEVIRQFAGHSSIAVTERYTRMRPDAIYDHVLRALG